MRKRNRHIGSSLESFLKEEGTLGEARAIALKESLAWQVQRAMKEENLSKMEMARRMNTSRAALDRFLSSGNGSVTLQTLTRAARAVDGDLRVELVYKRHASKVKIDSGRKTLSAVATRR